MDRIILNINGVHFYRHWGWRFTETKLRNLRWPGSRLMLTSSRLTYNVAWRRRGWIKLRERKHG
jgi:hypothetical protein